MKGGGHAWPGSKPYLPQKSIGFTCYDFHASLEIWNFFKSLP
jgi:poly(3-hydroxybutyrate) depolymerase